MTSFTSAVSGPRAIKLSMFLSRAIPEGLGHRAAGWAASVICRVKPAVYHTVHANLRQVMGPDASSQALEDAVRQVFITAMRSYFDLFRAVGLPGQELSALVDVPEATKANARALWNHEGGAVLVFPHLSNFDLGGHALVRYLPELQLLTLPNPPAGFEILNESRRRSGVSVTPVTSSALRQAIKLLRRGGLVSIAGDRPVSDLDKPVQFFDRPARVPSGHVRLALKTGAVMAVAYCIFSAETGRYTAYLEPPMELIRTGNLAEEVALNVRQVLGALEQAIRRWPEQWQMFVPVWTEGVQG
jgi:lauroyl/myristoyl acyltransferase